MGKWVDITVSDREGTHSISGTIEQPTKARRNMKANFAETESLTYTSFAQ